jgi:hypothetical protein
VREALGFRQKHATRERQEELKRKKQKFHSSPAARPREEERGTVSLKTTLFCSFFFLKSMKRRRFGQNAPFHLNMAPTCQLPNQSLKIAALIVGRLFHFGPWSRISSIKSLIGH